MIKYFFVILFFLYASTLYAATSFDDSLTFNSQLKNRSLPDIQWQDINGDIHHLKDSHGQVRLLHFWAAWCFPCRKELPEMLHWKEKNRDILLIPLSLDQRMAQTKFFIEKYKLNMAPLLMDKDASDALNIPALPYTIFVAADGAVIGQYHGIAPWHDDDFTKQIRKKFNRE